MLVPMMVSCTKELDLEVHELSDNVSDNKTLEVLIETATVPPSTIGWNDREIGFWKSMFWFRLAQDPRIRSRFEPKNVYGIASCIVETYKSKYDLKKFEIEIGNRQTPSSPELIQEAVEISRECSRFEVMKILQENQKNEINPYDTI